ncbi:MAG: hypothetical protein R2762_30020 [Bryobacteraceae bacterium]
MIGSHEILAFFVVTVIATKYVVQQLVRRAAPRLMHNTSIAVGAWLVVTALIAWKGWLQFGPMPPRILILVLFSSVFTVWVTGFTDFGRALATVPPLHWLIGMHAFRIAVEIFLHWGWREGFVPKQLTWESCNWDVLTGVTAIPMAWLASLGKVAKRGVLIWNCFGLALLVNVVTVAILSMPTPFRLFTNEPVNRFVTTAPYIWLPTFLVQAALFGHVLLFRRLLGKEPAPVSLNLSV